jgi:aldehyde dehydrogenase (NAD+)
MPLVEDRDVAVISFTGNGRTGTAIATAAAGRGKRLSMELGGKNGIVVMPDADLDLAIDGIVWSAFGTTGQRCTACSRLIVSEAVADDLVERVAARAQALRLGPGIEPSTDVGPLINAAAVEKSERYVGIGLAEGARLVTGGRRATSGSLAHGSFFEPTVLDGVDPMSRLGQEEVFGPVLSVIRVTDYDAAVMALNGVRYGLSSSIYTSDANTAFRAMRDFETGIVYVNAGTIGAETHLPFGGMKATGNGHREAGHAALDTFTEWKAVYVDYSGRLQRAQIDNQPVG